MIEVTATGIVIEQAFRRDRVRQDRIVSVGADHRIALEDLRFNGDLVTETTGGEFVSYVATLPTGEIYDSGDASYGLLDNQKTQIQGWYFYLKAPLFPTTIMIMWTVGIQAARQTWSEKIDVVASPLSNSSCFVVCDGVV